MKRTIGAILFVIYSIIAITVTVLLLSFTKCKRIIFAGSVGSISNDVNIGDLLIPSISVSGEAFSTYMYEEINKESLHKEYHPTKKLYDTTINYLKKN